LFVENLIAISAMRKASTVAGWVRLKAKRAWCERVSKLISTCCVLNMELPIKGPRYALHQLAGRPEVGVPALATLDRLALIDGGQAC
jgi:hypothetical protein